MRATSGVLLSICCILLSDVLAQQDGNVVCRALLDKCNAEPRAINAMTSALVGPYRWI
jgi:hypothetical protein